MDQVHALVEADRTQPPRVEKHADGILRLGRQAYPDAVIGLQLRHQRGERRARVGAGKIVALEWVGLDRHEHQAPAAPRVAACAAQAASTRTSRPSTNDRTWRSTRAACANSGTDALTLKDGLLAEVDGLQVEFDHDGQFNQKNIELELHDTAGRSTRLVGLHYAHFPLIPGPHTTLNEGAMRCEIDGRPGVGWSEFMWPTEYLGYIRERARQV